MTRAGPYNTATGLGDKGRVTSRGAASKAATTAALRRMEILIRIGDAGANGLTPEECAAAMSLDISSVRPRFSELSNAGSIVAQRDAADLRRTVKRRSRLGAKSTVMVTPAHLRGPAR